MGRRRRGPSASWGPQPLRTEPVRAGVRPSAPPQVRSPLRCGPGRLFGPRRASAAVSHGAGSGDAAAPSGRRGPGLAPSQLEAPGCPQDGPATAPPGEARRASRGWSRQPSAGRIFWRVPGTGAEPGWPGASGGLRAARLWRASILSKSPRSATSPSGRGWVLRGGGSSGSRSGWGGLGSASRRSARPWRAARVPAARLSAGAEPRRKVPSGPANSSRWSPEALRPKPFALARFGSSNPPLRSSRAPQNRAPRGHLGDFFLPRKQRRAERGAHATPRPPGSPAPPRAQPPGPRRL